MLSIMKKLTIILILIFIYSAGCSTSPEKRLIGYWISDKERTFKEINPKIPENKRFLAQISIGGSRINYTDDTFEWNYRGRVYKHFYEVIEASNKSITINIYDGECNKGYIQKIFLGQNSYWTKSYFGNFYEYFKRSYPQTKPVKYTQSEVKKIADSYAEDWGFILNEYETPKIRYYPENLIWCLYYDGKPIDYTESGEPLVIIDNHFKVCIDSFTNEVWLR